MADIHTCVLCNAFRQTELVSYNYDPVKEKYWKGTSNPKPRKPHVSWRGWKISSRWKPANVDFSVTTQSWYNVDTIDYRPSKIVKSKSRQFLDSWFIFFYGFFMIYLWLPFMIFLWFFTLTKKIINGYLWEFPWEYNANDECYDFFMISRKFHEIPKENSKK